MKKKIIALLLVAAMAGTAGCKSAESPAGTEQADTGIEVVTESFHETESTEKAEVVAEGTESTETEAESVQGENVDNTQTQTEESVAEQKKDEDKDSKGSKTETTQTETTKTDTTKTETQKADTTKTETQKAESVKRATMYAKLDLNIRKGPGTSYDKAGALATNDEVTTIGEKDAKGWIQIESKKGNGYVASKYLSTEKVKVETAKTETTKTETTKSESKTETGSNQTDSTQTSSKKGEDIKDPSGKVLFNTADPGIVKRKAGEEADYSYKDTTKTDDAGYTLLYTNPEFVGGTYPCYVWTQYRGYWGYWEAHGDPLSAVKWNTIMKQHPTYSPVTMSGTSFQAFEEYIIDDEAMGFD